MKRFGRTLAILALAVAAVLLGMSVRISFNWIRLFGASRDPAREALAIELDAARDPMEIFTKVAKFVGPSVVSIRGDLDQLTVFGERVRQEQAGTGIIVDADGYVVTNYHVIDNADRLEVELANGKRYRAKLRGGDKGADLAVLEISAPELVPARFGDSDAIEVGQTAIAIGNAFELRNTVTHGIISAKARPVIRPPVDERGPAIPMLDDFIQTDAPINPGNSGGPLVDIRGRVIGINTMIYSRSGTSAGVGFAIPINYARQVIRQIIETGHISRGGIGITARPKANDLDNRNGVLVEGVTPGSPADVAGVEPSDLIVELDGRPIRNFVELKSVASKLEEGRKTTIKVQRQRRVLSLPITIGSLEKLESPNR